MELFGFPVFENDMEIEESRVVVEAVGNMCSLKEYDAFMGDLNSHASSCDDYGDSISYSSSNCKLSVESLADDQSVDGNIDDDDDDELVDIETVDTDNMAERIKSLIDNSLDYDEAADPISAANKSPNQSDKSEQQLSVSSIPLKQMKSVVKCKEGMNTGVKQNVTAKPRVVQANINVDENLFEMANNREIIEADNLTDLFARFEDEMMTGVTETQLDEVVSTAESPISTDEQPSHDVFLDSEFNFDTNDLGFQQVVIEDPIYDISSTVEIFSPEPNGEPCVIEDRVIVDGDVPIDQPGEEIIHNADHDYCMNSDGAAVNIQSEINLPPEPVEPPPPRRMTSILKPRITVQRPPQRAARERRHKPPDRDNSNQLFNKLPGYMTVLSVPKIEDNTKISVPREVLDGTARIPNGMSPLRDNEPDDLYTRIPSYCREIGSGKKYDVTQLMTSSEEENQNILHVTDRNKSYKHHRKHKYGSSTVVSNNQHYCYLSNSDELTSSRKLHNSRSTYRRRSKRDRNSTSSYSSTSSYTSTSRSRSPISPIRTKNRRRRRRTSSNSDREDHSITDKKAAHEKAISERRVVYVGGIPNGYTPTDVRRRFQVFGQIQTSTVHFRETGDNYAFVTFERTQDAFKAIEEGNQTPGPKFTLCFGGRRKFCKTDYADLDGCTAVKEEWAINEPIRRSGADDFDALLKNTLKKLKT